MVNYEFIMEKHIKDNKNKYVSPMTMLIILEEIFGMSFDEIKSSVESSKITISESEINEVLNYGMKSLELNYSEKDIKNIGKLEPKKAAERFAKKLERKKYTYEPYTLDYYKRYTNIVKRKSLLLLKIVECLAQYKSELVEELLDELDIELDRSGRITYEDIIRILIPTTNNIKDLFSKTKDGNTVATYMINKISKEELNRRGIRETEIYPLETLQVMDLDFISFGGYVPLSEKQKETLKEKYAENTKKLVKNLIKNINN